MSATPANPPRTAAGRGRRILARTLVVVGIAFAVVSALANFVKYELLDDAQFTETSRLLIANDEIRSQVAVALVNGLYENVDVASELESELPPNLKALAGPIAGLSRELADRAAERLLERPATQALWVDLMALSQDRLVALLKGDTRFVDTANGAVVLDLEPLVARLAERFSFAADAIARLPPNAARITILESGELGLAQDVTHLLEIVANWIWVLALAAWAGAIWLARGRRRIEVRAIAIGLVVTGFLLVAVRVLAGHYIVDTLVQSESVKPAAQDAWNIVTRLLAGSGWSLVIIGIVALAGVWLAGPGRRATAVREALAPSLARPEVAYGTVAVLYVLLLLWQPTPQFGRWLWVVVFAVLAGAGLEVVRRKAAHDFPDAAGRPSVVEGLGERLGSWRSSRARAAAPASVSASVSEELERLSALRASGALSDEEFTKAKLALLGGTTSSTP